MLRNNKIMHLNLTFAVFYDKNSNNIIFPPTLQTLFLFRNMNSSEKGQEMSLQKPKDQGNGRRRASILLGVVSAVAFVAALGVCAALLNTKPAGPISSQNTHRDTENSHLQQRSLVRCIYSNYYFHYHQI